MVIITENCLSPIVSNFVVLYHKCHKVELAALDGQVNQKSLH